MAMVRQELPVHDKRGHKLRKDSRVAAALLFQASPGWKGNQAELMKSCMNFVKNNLKGKAVHFAFHNDEKTPHLHVIFVPKDDQGRANFRDQFGGKKDESAAKLSRLHDQIAEQVGEPFGLTRGDRGKARAYGGGSRREREARLAYEQAINERDAYIDELQEALQKTSQRDQEPSHAGGGVNAPLLDQTRSQTAPTRATLKRGANEGRD